jgi:outer membrane protein OmpA-like peptidoglycan-associated protein
MNRRLVPLILLMLVLFGGAVWALLGPLQLMPAALRPAALKPDEEKPQTAETHKAPGTPGAPEAVEAAKPAPPTANPNAMFDVARIDPTGTSVFAGHTEPGNEVTIKADGREIGTATADDNGEWTFVTEHKFTSADPSLDVSIKSAAEIKQARAAAAASGKPEPGKTAEKSGAPTPGAGGAPSSESKAAEAGEKPAKPHTASEVTTALLNDLKGMVEAAREGKPDPAPAPGAAPGATNGAPANGPPATQPGGTPEPGKAADKAGGAPGAAAVATVNLSASTGETVRKSIPVPVTFVFNEASFTDDGRKAASLLLEYLKLKRFGKVTLTGHADERGSDELNMQLSRDRLQTVANFLKAGGFAGELELVPKGKSEPYLGVARGDYDQEELWQLDRRVELVIAPGEARTVR